MARYWLAFLLCGMLGAACAGKAERQDTVVLGHPADDAVLYRLRTGLNRHIAGDFKGSNVRLEEALRIIADQPMIQLGNEAVSWTLVEVFERYSGDPHELLFLHTLGMLNYAMLGDVEEALVEARRFDQLQRWLETEGKLAYDEPFGRYLAAKLYEADGSFDDSYIDLVKAREGFRYGRTPFDSIEPSFLGADLVRVALKSGRREEALKWKKRYPGAYRSRDGFGEIWVIVWGGELQWKDGRLWPVAQMELGSGQVRVGGSYSVPLEKVYNLMPALMEKQRARRSSANQRAGARTFLMATLYATLVIATKGSVQPSSLPSQQQAVVDGRHWDNLPTSIFASRLELPKGRQVLEIDLRMGNRTATVKQSVRVPEGKIALVRVAVDAGEIKTGVSPKAK